MEAVEPLCRPLKDLDRYRPIWTTGVNTAKLALELPTVDFKRTVLSVMTGAWWRLAHCRIGRLAMELLPVVRYTRFTNRPFLALNKGKDSQPPKRRRHAPGMTACLSFSRSIAVY